LSRHPEWAGNLLIRNGLSIVIKHIVMWKLKDGAGGASKAENALRVKELLDGCSQAVPGILKFEAVVAQEGLESTCDVMLYSEFTSREALQAYNRHPLHQDLKARVSPLREDRQSFDYEI
jgi:quinol monooxygenase YgiN